MRIKINTGKRTPQMRILSAFMAFLIFSLTCPELFEGWGIGLIVHATPTYHTIQTGNTEGCMSGTSGSDSNYTYSGKIKTGDVTVFDYLTDREIEGASINLGPWGSGGYLDPYTLFNGTISAVPNSISSTASDNVTINYDCHILGVSDVKVYLYSNNGNTGWNNGLMSFDSTAGSLLSKGFT